MVARKALPARARARAIEAVRRTPTLLKIIPRLESEKQTLQTQLSDAHLELSP